MKIKIICHRGVHYTEKENTLPAFKQSLKFDGAELDVRQTKDGKIVVSHDATLSRVFNVNARIKSSDYKEIKIIPLLSQALKVLKSKFVMVEIKEEGIEEKVLKEVKKSKAENVMIISFLENSLKKVRKLDGKIKTGLITISPFKAVDEAVKLKCNAVCFFHKIAPEFMIRKAREKGLEAYIWTVDSKEEFKKFSTFNINGVVSNNPGGLK
jgi:glycerophosphoryl diester phosphodiesterase